DALADVQRIPVPVTTVAGFNPGTGTGGGTNNLVTPYTSFQYQDVGIKVAMEPRVHHNREVTLKLTVEVSNRGNDVTFAGQSQPTFATRTIESTIRLKDGETNFLAGLIQTNQAESEEKTPFLGDLPFVGRLFSKEKRDELRTDLVLTMTPHIIRIPDITEEDLAPMWVGTGTNLTFRGVSPRIESQGSNGDPFSARNEQQFRAQQQGLQPATDGEPGNYIMPAVPQGSAPSDPFRRPQPTRPPLETPPPNPNQPPPVDQDESASNDTAAAPKFAAASVTATLEPDTAALRLAPRIAPQPSTLALGPGESKIWNIVGMDLEGLSTPELLFHFNPRAMDVMEVSFGSALQFDANLPPVVAIDRNAGTIRIKSANAAPLQFASGGVVLGIRVLGGLTGETFLVIDNPDLRNGNGQSVVAAIAGGKARVE
ncbi:MAG TPA: type II and III secretion system protein, partial [Vicinamibacterales bacterium]|nr:type II and III secretion system protein [Vicinamibacterales bacterium]